AFQSSFRLNPSLALAHNFYTHLQVDQGRSLEAMQRLLERAQRRRNDPELFAGLAHVCRYCGLLPAAVAAHQEARRLDPQIPTTVMNTYFLLGDYERALESSSGDFGYSVAITLAALGRAPEAVTLLRKREHLRTGRLAGLYVTSLRALLEGHRGEGLQAINELCKATFRAPDGLVDMLWERGYLGERCTALEMLSRAITRGFFCYRAMLRDPWLDSVRENKHFTTLLQRAQNLYQEASQAFFALNGDAVLGTRQQEA